MLSFFAGLGLGLSLIVAIGAQNVYVLRQGIRRRHVIAVVAICALSDAVLIIAGVAGLGYLLESMPWLINAARVLGAVFLFGYGALAARRALRPGGDALRADEGADRTVTSALLPVILTALALTWLNPHVYLDTVLLLGSIAATHGETRWFFAAGAVLASAVWFTALGFGARYLGRWLDTPRSWRILDALIAVVMIALAVSLVLPVITG
ncbi:LysE/ArgO family amino acid transporter [Microbacterium sp. A93]|uniref:LysE/ArgO family amino acid transporter n=1 Tax=Microbacterium sp. A93 TaxID=3450716 RepID=UPI003F42A377